MDVRDLEAMRRGYASYTAAPGYVQLAIDKQCEGDNKTNKES